MNPNKAYRICSPDVVHETIDGEVVVVHLKTGTYYSTEKSGTDIWNGIDRGLSVQQIINTLETRYSGSSDDIEAGVELMLQLLLQEKLIAAHEEASETDGDGWMMAEKGTAFEMPVIQKYADMEELLVLDPIHEVGDGGWPQPAE